MDLSSIVEDFGENMPDWLRTGMQIKYQITDRRVLEEFCEKYKTKLVRVCIEEVKDESKYNPQDGVKLLYFFEGNPIGHTREALEISLQDTQVIVQ